MTIKWVIPFPKSKKGILKSLKSTQNSKHLQLFLTKRFESPWRRDRRENTTENVDYLGEACRIDKHAL